MLSKRRNQLLSNPPSLFCTSKCVGDCNCFLQTRRNKYRKRRSSKPVRKARRSVKRVARRSVKRAARRSRR